MSGSLLEKTRKLNAIIQNTGHVSVSFAELCTILQGVLDSNVYVASKKGKMLGYSLINEDDSSGIVLSKEDNDEILKLKQTKLNDDDGIILDIFKDDIKGDSSYISIVPIIGSGQRLGTLIAARGDNRFDEDDIILAEYAATVVGMEMLKSKSDKVEEEERKKSIVAMAIGTLSYSELEAVEHIFQELGGSEGKLVASKIADRVGITRSVIVNALRKFESAGVIESRSLGMKGTYIKVLNEKLFDELRRTK